jgi:hypothetical protein
MKYFLILLMLFNTALAQVTWTHSTVGKFYVTTPNGERIHYYRVTFTATIDDGWHIYSKDQDTSQFIGVATKFTCDSLSGISEHGDAITYTKDGIVDIEYEKTVRYTLYFYDSKTTGTISVLYMACTEYQCNPPVKETFKLDIP